jgi:SAM-dependent MidA family methyltransferase
MTAEIFAEIATHGAIPFERFMELALYGNLGFYTRADGGSAGRRGDFITSPEVGPLFGAVLARYMDAEWDRIGQPEEFTVIDVGAGPGTLARAVMAAAPRCATALNYVAVEVSVRQHERHSDQVTSVSSLPSAPIDGVVIANELLDNMAFRLAVSDNGWREAFVDVSSDGRLVEVLSAPIAPLSSHLPPDAPLGARAPLIERSAACVTEMRCVVRSGAVLTIDYGVRLTAGLAGRPWRDWLRTYRGHERGEHYLASPGTQDITTDIPFDQLPEPDSIRTQSQFLQRWGINELVEEGKRVWQQQAARPGLEAMKMRSRISESEALLDVGGLGSFLVAEWRAD